MHTKNIELNSFHLGGALGDIEHYENDDALANASFTHVYGSTEAEPVAFCDLRESIQKSKEKNYAQTLFLGNQLMKSLYKKEGILWVSGVHVSPMYENDPIANGKNKWTDESGKLWHNMGDQIIQRRWHGTMAVIFNWQVNLN